MQQQKFLNMNTAQSLFQSQAFPLDDLIKTFSRQADAKCKEMYVTFGIFKGKKGDTTHNAMVVITDKHGKHYSTTLAAESIHHMIERVNELLITIKA
jgi:hypothetical protein